MTTRASVTMVLALVASAPGQARADRREASLHAQLIGGVGITTDRASAESGSAPLGGVSGRASYATSNWFQYDLAMSFLATGGAAFSSGTFMPAGRPPVSGPFTVPTQLTRLDGGVTLRMGVAWIPTLRVALGAQARRRGAPTVTTGGLEVTGEDQTGRGSELGLDLVGLGAVGLDHRLSRRLIVGGALGLSLALPLDGESFRTFEATVHASYYWYPR